MTMLVVRLLVVVFMVLPVFAAQAKPQRVVSIHLCADQMALMLLKPERIKSLTYNAPKPEYSAYYDRVGDIPINYGSVEEVISYNPDLVIAGVHSAKHKIRMLRDLGYEVLALSTISKLDGVRKQIRDVAKVLGEDKRGEGIIKELDAGLAAAARPPRSPPQRAAIYHFNSQTIGSDSLVDELMTLAGYRNFAAELGIFQYGYLSLETLIAGQPELVIFEGERTAYPAVGRGVLSHPAVKSMLGKSKAIVIPSRLWACATPHIAKAAQMISGKRSP